MIPSGTGGSGSENKLARLSSSGLLAAAMMGASTILGKLFGRSVTNSTVPGFDSSGNATDYVVGTTGSSLLSAGSAGDGRTALGLATTDSPTFAAVTTTGNVNVGGNAVVTGNLIVSGNKTINGAELEVLSSNYLLQNAGYNVASGQSGGVALNYLPTSTNTTVNGVYTAGVASTSNPTVVTTGSGTFAAGDIISIASGINKGFYEVADHTGTTLTIKGVGTVACTEDWSINQFTAGSSDGAAIRKVNVAVNKVDASGVPMFGKGSTAPLTYSYLLLADGSAALTANLDADGFTISNLADPTNPQEPVTLAYFNANNTSATLTITGVKTANYTAAIQEHVRADASGGGFNVQLPDAGTYIGQIVEVCNEGASGTVTVTRGGSDLISGATSDALLASQEVAGYRSIATNVWRRIY
jgi:hypothetical protein